VGTELTEELVGAKLIEELVGTELKGIELAE
jgi:hypothetical protein